MDQVKIGKFIAQMRKEQNLTQRGLADKLSISDKTVSKWERGRGLPEVSLMLPLCGALGITVNDLLTGQRVAEADYQTRAEENMMNLLRENAENKKRMALSVICGCVTVIAVCALVALASFLEVAADGAWRYWRWHFSLRQRASPRRPCWRQAPGTTSAPTARSCSCPPWAPM